MTIADFKTRFPEFSAVDDTRISLFIEDAEAEMSESAWGTLYSKGLAYLTAHLLTIGTKTGAGNSAPSNVLQSHSVEGVSESFAVPSMSEYNSTLSSTSYGAEYVRLRRLISAGALSV